jgi:hypothetical protein
MTDAVDSSTLALVCYPGLWDASCELHPRNSTYDWRAHLRTLCKLCKAYLASDPRSRTPWALVPEAEKTYLLALSRVPVEMLILDIVRERAGRADLPAWELWWADPFDSHLKPEPVAVRDGRPRPI